MEIIKVLKSYGYNEFRGDQEAVIKATLEGKNTLCLMPTGMGKSLCYQIPAQILGGLTVVVSPLIALMRDQVEKAQKKGLRAVDIHSLLNSKERASRYEKLARGDYQVVFVAPERFRKDEFLQALGHCDVKLLVIDEAHCISEWGHDFRPDYTRISEFRKFLKNPTTLMLTATATPDVQKDIVKQAGFEWSQVTKFHSGIERKNLALNVWDLYGMDNKIEALQKVLQEVEGPKIVYFSLIGTLEKVSEKLKFDHFKYHGQLSRSLRDKMQKNFLNSQDAVILATPAFGLGIDKRNIRSVVHFEMPGNLESYYQEVGRAGRDGQDSQCHLLYDEDDVTIQMEFQKWAHPDAEFLQRVFRLLQNNLEKANAVGLDGLREELHFKSKKDFRLETSLNLFERWGVTEGEISEKNLNLLTKELPKELKDSQRIDLRLKNDQKKLLAMVQWVNTQECRAQRIYKYFGFDDFDRCGKCDNCRAST